MSHDLDPMSAPPEGVFVGVKMTQDGEWDFSAAARVNITPPARGEHTEEEPTPEAQPWLNQERELTFTALIDYYRELRDREPGDAALRSAFAQIINKNAGAIGVTERLTITELSKLQYGVANSPVIDEIVGQEIKRPIFITHDAELTSKLARMLTGRDMSQTLGFVAPSRYMLDGAPSDRADLMVASSIEGYHVDIPTR
jgi:hypothetical protein